MKKLTAVIKKTDELIESINDMNEELCGLIDRFTEYQEFLEEERRKLSGEQQEGNDS